jgi:hypothetical protein
MKVLGVRLRVVIGVSICAWGHSAAEIAKKYSALEVYEIQPGIWMSPSYALDGRVCEMVLEKRHATKTLDKTTIDEDTSFTRDLVKALVDELVPASERGGRLKDPQEWDTTIKWAFHYHKKYL